jgi:hypothetical protein
MIEPELKQNPISRQKLLEFLRAAKMSNSDVDNTNRYMYILGNNRVISHLYVSIICGDLDQGDEGNERSYG